MLLWWYYDRVRSETRCLSPYLDRCIEVMELEEMITSREKRELLTTLKDWSSYYDTKYSIRKVELHGELAETLYVLERPLGIYSSKEEAHKVGVKHVIEREPEFLWKKSAESCFYVTCDRAWFHSNKITSWSKAWQLRIVEDHLFTENTLERVNSHKIFVEN